MSLVPISVWPRLGTTVTLASGYVITAAGAIATATDEILGLLRTRHLLTYDPSHANPNPSPIPPINTGGGVSVGSMAALASTIGLVSGEVADVRGFLSDNDGGGGPFCFTFGFSLTPLTGMVVNCLTGQWSRLYDKRECNVRWFGAKGDGVADDTAALQRAMTFATVTLPDASFGGLHVKIPQGKYRVTDTVYIQGGFLKGNVRVTGANVPGAQLTNTQIFWDGASYTGANPKPILWIEASDCIVENISLQGMNSKTLYSCIEVGSTQVGVPKALTHNQFAGVTCVATTSNPVNCGVSVGTINPQSSNLENFRFTECLFQGTFYGVWFYQGQPINTVFTDTVFSNNLPGIRGTGVRIQSPSMSAQFFGCDFQSLEMGVQAVGGCTNVTMVGGESENCKKIFQGSLDGVGVPGALSIRGMRLSPTQVNATTLSFPAADHNFIYNYAGTSITLEDCFSYDGGTPVDWKIAYPASCRVVSTNCDYPNANPFAPFADYRGTSAGGLWSTGDRYVDGVSAELQPLPTKRGSHNVSYAGALSTVSGAATSIAVTLPVSEIVGDYNVDLQVESVTGAPAAGAFCGYVTSKTATGFTINVPVAPGGATAVVYRYTTWR